MDSIEWPSGSPDTINYKALDIHLAKYQVGFNLFIRNYVNANSGCLPDCYKSKHSNGHMKINLFALDQRAC